MAYSLMLLLVLLCSGSQWSPSTTSLTPAVCPTATTSTCCCPSFTCPLASRCCSRWQPARTSWWHCWLNQHHQHQQTASNHQVGTRAGLEGWVKLFCAGSPPSVVACLPCCRGYKYCGVCHTRSSRGQATSKWEQQVRSLRSMPVQGLKLYS